MPFEIEAGKGPNIPAGTYPAVLESVTESADEGKFGSKYRIWNWLVEHDGKIDSLSSFTSLNSSPSSGAYKVLTALLGAAPQIGTTVPDPVGNRVLLQLTVKENGYPKVEAVLPYTEPQQVIPGIPR